MAQVQKNEELQVLLEDVEYQLLSANKKVTEAVVAVGKAYQQVFEAAIDTSFAQWKSFNKFVAKQAE